MEERKDGLTSQGALSDCLSTAVFDCPVCCCDRASAESLRTDFKPDQIIRPEAA